MDAQHVTAILIPALAYAALGALTAGLHLTLLSVNVRALMGGRRGWIALAAPARGAATVAVFALIALAGAPALIAALAGFALARTALVHRPEVLLP